MQSSWSNSHKITIPAAEKDHPDQFKLLAAGDWRCPVWLCTRNTINTSSCVLAEGAKISLSPPLVHLWWYGHSFCCGIGSYRGPYSIRYETFKTGQGGIGFLLSPELCSGSRAFGSSAKAMTDMLCCNEVGFLGVRIAIPSYNTVQQLGLFLEKAFPLQHWALPHAEQQQLGSAWWEVGLSFSYIDRIKTSEQFTPAKLLPK